MRINKDKSIDEESDNNESHSDNECSSSPQSISMFEESIYGIGAKNKRSSMIWKGNSLILKRPFIENK